jgi:hypothetical protein
MTSYLSFSILPHLYRPGGAELLANPAKNALIPVIPDAVAFGPVQRSEGAYAHAARAAHAFAVVYFPWHGINIWNFSKVIKVMAYLIFKAYTNNIADYE